MNDLFGQDIDERTIPVSQPQRRVTRPNGYARRPGSGPAGQTCKTCVHCVGTGAHKHIFYKCLVIRHRWTAGPGTDILLRSPACEMFSPAPK